MHELSIVYGVIDAVTDTVAKMGAREVKTVTLRVGALSAIVEDALQFGFDIATKDTVLDGSKLIVRRMPLIIRCETCQQDRELPSIQSFRCPVCNTLSGDILQGRELEIESVEIEVEDDDSNR